MLGVPMPGPLIVGLGVSGPWSPERRGQRARPAPPGPFSRAI